MRVFLTVLFCIVLATGVAAEKRVALVVGNSAYERISSLRNAASDAKDLAAKLESIGFEVHLGLDTTGAEMRTMLVRFGRAAAEADSALFFYAGHGIQSDGENYLVPVEADIAFEDEIELTLVPMGTIVSQLGRARGTRLVFLDACRDNPFRKRLMQGMGTRGAASLAGGLSQPRAMPGTFVAYATQPDDVASDGADRNSPFTSALLRHIGTPGQTLPDLMMAVGRAVRASTDSRQDPWWSSSLREQFMFVPPNESATVDLKKIQGDFLFARELASDIAWRAFIHAYESDESAGLLVETARAELALLTASVVETKPLTISIGGGMTVAQALRRIADDKNLSGEMPPEPPLEGMLAAETLRYPPNTQRQTIIGRLAADQKALVEEIWKTRSEKLPLASIGEFLTLASIVQKEARDPADRARMAALFLNRLEKGLRLQSNTTMIYGLAGPEGSFDRAITRQDMEAPNPYNTYLFEGLPEGPISIPDRAALEAVARPAETNDLFVVSDGGSGHLFAATLAEHIKNVRRFRELQSQRTAEQED